MKCDIVFAGVGGQGVLSMAAVIGRAALGQGLHAKQSEVHGMAQRGGAVHAHLRLSDRPIASDLIPLGTADLVLSLEPVEALRYLAYLAPAGALITAANPVVNFPEYPDLEALLARLRSMPNAVAIDAERLATEAGDLQCVNTVMVGAASPALALSAEWLEQSVVETFERKGPAVVETNVRAFRLGREAAGAELAAR